MLSNQSNNLELNSQSMQKVFYIVAGEASGDILGARLMNELQLLFPKSQFHGIGGEQMQAAGLKEFYPMERLSVMGVLPIISRLPELLAMRKRLAKQVIDNNADCFIGIDAPVFNTELEYQLKQKGILTVHYVSPSVWAWRENRIYKIVKSVSLMICLFPFELDIYKKHQLPAVSIGHPLADEIPIEIDGQTKRKELGLPLDKPILSILPGSRGSEMKFLLQPFLEAAEMLVKKYADLHLIIPCANKKRELQLQRFLEENSLSIEIQIFSGQSREVMAASDLVLLASGTATLEAMLLKKPMVVAYKVSGISYWIYTKFLKIKNFALPNLLAGNKIVAELIQADCTKLKIVDAISVLHEERDKEKLFKEYKKLHLQLRNGGSKKAANAIHSLMVNKK